MTWSPETRESLLQRLPNAEDREAWERFVDVYGPLLFRLARAKGLQPADAEDFVQESLAAVSRAIGRWLASSDRGRFRPWLFRIAQNLAINFLTRPKHRPLASGADDVARLLDEQPAPDENSRELYELEFRREVFRWAAEQVRGQVADRQWRAFWLTSVEGTAADEAARSLDMSLGAVYVARSRITKRIRSKVTQYEEPGS